MSLANGGAVARTRRALQTSRRKLQRSEQLLRQAQAELRSQRRYAATVAHDLRAPLQTINVALALIADEESPNIQRPLRLAQTALERAEALLHDLLDAAAPAPRRRAPTDRKLHALDELVACTVEDLRLRFPDRVLEHQPSRGDTSIEADADRVSRILDNLISNALLHGAPNTPVAVQVDAEDDHVGLHVLNRGSLAEDARTRLFQPMDHGEQRSRRGGMGLGLYIVKQLAEAHGGRVEVSGDAKHTAFSVFFPRAARRGPLNSA